MVDSLLILIPYWIKQFECVYVNNKYPLAKKKRRISLGNHSDSQDLWHLTCDLTIWPWSYSIITTINSMFNSEYLKLLTDLAINCHSPIISISATSLAETDCWVTTICLRLMAMLMLVANYHVAKSLLMLVIGQ